MHFQGANCDLKVLILLYTPERKVFLGFIPNDQVAFVDRLKKVIQHQKTNLALSKNQGAAGTSSAGGGNPPPPLPQQQQPQQSIVMPQANAMAMAGGQITQNIVTSSASPVGMGGLLGQTMRQNTMRMHVSD